MQMHFKYIFHYYVDVIHFRNPTFTKLLCHIYIYYICCICTINASLRQLSSQVPHYAITANDNFLIKRRQLDSRVILYDDDDRALCDDEAPQYCKVFEAQIQWDVGTVNYNEK